MERREQLTRIELLDRQKAAGLEQELERMISVGRTHQELQARIRERTGELVPLSTISSWATRRVHAKNRRIRKQQEIWQGFFAAIDNASLSKLRRRQLFEAVNAMLESGAALDPVEASKMELRWAEYELKCEGLEQNKKDLEYRLEKLERDEASKRQEIAEVVRDEQAAAEDIRRRIREIYGLFDAPASGAPAAVSGEMGQG
jgi:hypothetical protein